MKDNDVRKSIAKARAILDQYDTDNVSSILLIVTQKKGGDKRGELQMGVCTCGIGSIIGSSLFELMNRSKSFDEIVTTVVAKRMAQATFENITSKLSKVIEKAEKKIKAKKGKK